MHRAKKSPNRASLCAILSSTDLIVLLMLCRARSEADTARRLRPPSPRARELSGQRVDLLFRLLGTLDLSQLLGFVQLFAQVGKPPPVGDLGLLVEHLARITQTADMDPRSFEILGSARQTLLGLTVRVIVALACDTSRQIKDMEFD